MFREVREWFEEISCRVGLDAWSPGAKRIAIGVVIAVVAGAVWRWGTGAPGPGTSMVPTGPRPSAEATSATRPSSLATVTVHVVGSVRRPGVYRISGGGRVDDAVAAAGGLLGSADQAAVNLARMVNDGEQIAVPAKGATAVRGGAPGASGAVGGGVPGAGAKIDLNSATAEQLDTLPGVGPATAKKIVDDRTQNGPYRTVDDLLRVPGIGAKKLDALKDLVTAG
jgi:competence protein ComEA